MSTYEKSGLPQAITTPNAQPQRKRRSALLPLALASIFGVLVWHSDLTLSSVKCLGPTQHHYTAADLADSQCPAQPPALAKGTHWDILHDSAYADLAASRLSRAVQHATESYDNYPLNASDPIFDKHYSLAGYLESEFPKVYSALKHEVVNYHGQLFTWSGSDESLKPVLLMGHLDTVPVLPATRDQWTHDPFEGVVTEESDVGRWIWGRGVSDCKNSVMGILGAVERLVTEGFEPERSIILAFGFDEEVCLCILLLGEADVA